MHQTPLDYKLKEGELIKIQWNNDMDERSGHLCKALGTPGVMWHYHVWNSAKKKRFKAGESEVESMRDVWKVQSL